MEAVIGDCNRSFGEEHFGDCGLGDARLTARLVHSADAIMKHPGGTLPDKMGDPGSLMGFYRLANNPKASHQKVLAAHGRRTVARMDQVKGVVLLIHDWTELDYSGLESVQDLGPIGNGTCLGFLCDNVMAMDFDRREVIGLANQVLHTRRRVPARETPKAKRAHAGRESRLWVKGLQGLPPASNPASQRVHVIDRGGDCFEVFDRIRLRQEHCVIRSKSDRNIELIGADASVRQAKLHEYARSLETLGTRSVKVSANTRQSARTTRVGVSAAAVRVPSPRWKRGEHGDAPIDAWVIHVREIEPPPGAQALEWILISSLPCVTFEQACRAIDFYCCRPIVEELHKAMKTGCGIELPQFTTRAALEVTVALLSVVAIQLLRLRDLSRKPDAAERPATELFAPIYVTALTLWRFKGKFKDLSVHEFFMALARLGGHLNRKHDHPPGWLVLWRGWSQLQLLVVGVKVARFARCV